MMAHMHADADADADAALPAQLRVARGASHLLVPVPVRARNHLS